jgi:beta-N-acetylhexosaminidase
MFEMLSRRQACAVGAGCLAVFAGGGLAGCTTQEVQDSAREVLSQEDIEERTQRLVASMSLEHKAAQTIIATPEQVAGVELALYAGELTEAALAECPVGGFLYSGQNLNGEDQIKKMVSGARVLSASAGARIAPFLCVSEEGGTQLSPIATAAGIPTPSTAEASELGTGGDVEAAAEAAATIAAYVERLGFNVNFAPQASVRTNSESVLGTRAFSSDTAVVTQMVKAQVEAYLAADLLCDVPDYTAAGATCDFTAEEIETIMLPPFQAAIDAGDLMVLTSSITTPAVTDDTTPVCASPYWLQEVLREQMGFTGVIVGARLDSEACLAWKDEGSAAVAMLAAGCDMVSMPDDPNYVQDAIVAAVEDGTLSEERLNEAVCSIVALKYAAGIQEV